MWKFLVETNIAIAIFLRCSAGIFTKAVGRDQFQFLLRNYNHQQSEAKNEARKYNPLALS